jgi:hypothetical protein
VKELKLGNFHPDTMVKLSFTFQLFQLFYYIHYITIRKHQENVPNITQQSFLPQIQRKQDIIKVTTLSGLPLYMYIHLSGRVCFAPSKFGRLRVDSLSSVLTISDSKEHTQKQRKSLTLKQLRTTTDTRIITKTIVTELNCA